MLRRFQQISGIGCYSACRPAQIQFERMSLIYGENCYGKSTLCDILRSLAENEPSYITDRITVLPVGVENQNVQLSFRLPGQDQEVPFTFRDVTWNPTMPDSLKIEVFDTDFIHRNLFTGISIERQNHENITRFVLGDSGVRTAQRISDIKTELRALNKRLREVETSLFAGIADLCAFLALDVVGDLPTLERNIADILSTIETERRLSQDLGTARARLEPTTCAGPPALEGIIARIEDTLSATFELAHQDAETRLRAHLENHTQDFRQARNWIQQGRALMRNDECPFCGQKIKGNAVDLIAAYQTVFNDAFEHYAVETKATLDTAQREFANASCADLRIRIGQNQNACFQYPELRNRPDIRPHFESADEISAQLIRQCEEWNATHARLAESLAIAVQSKRENIHTAVSPWGGEVLVNQQDELARSITEYNHCLDRILVAITEFKRGLDAAQVDRRLQIAQRQLETLRLEKRRIENDTACRNYSDAVTLRSNREEEVVFLQEMLEREQTDFLAQYLTAINRVFTSLGSGRFAIAAEHSHRGNMPTVQLSMSFNGVQIAPQRLRAFFSESDRRALAFAIFWARLETRDAADRAHTIVVLDDPVTSFDDGRIDRTIRMIETQLPHLRQVIILSHYSAYLKTFFNRLHGQQDGLLIATLYQDGTGTQIRRANPLDFVETDHQRAYRHIATFIEREHTNDILCDLRVFLETEVRTRYHRTICNNNLREQQFATLLDELVQVGSMTNETRQALEPFRLTLNTDHHVWTARSHEEKIGIARDTLQFIYESL